MNNPSVIKLWFALGLNGLGIFWQGSLLLEILAHQNGRQALAKVFGFQDAWVWHRTDNLGLASQQAGSWL